MRQRTQTVKPKGPRNTFHFLWGGRNKGRLNEKALANTTPKYFYGKLALTGPRVKVTKGTAWACFNVLVSTFLQEQNRTVTIPTPRFH